MTGRTGTRQPSQQTTNLPGGPPVRKLAGGGVEVPLPAAKPQPPGAWLERGPNGSITAQLPAATAPSTDKQAAIESYRYFRALKQHVDSLQAQYEAGPGATSGISSILDYLPFQRNNLFDELGRSAGRLATGALASRAGTSPKAYAEYLSLFTPQSSDSDAVASNKIHDLQEVANRGLRAQVAKLGGVPDEHGNIIPLSLLPSQPPPAQRELATGATRNEIDPEQSAHVERLILAGFNAPEIYRAMHWPEDPDAMSKTQAEINAVRAYRKSYPNYTDFARIDRQVPNSFWSQLAASPVGGYFIGASSAVADPKLYATADQQELIGDVQRRNPYAWTIGNVTNNVLLSAALEPGIAALDPRLTRLAPALADGITGAWQGYGGSDKGDGLLGTTLGVIENVGGGMLTRGGLRVAGRAIGGLPEDSRYVSRLRDFQTLGDPIHLPGEVSAPDYNASAIQQTRVAVPTGSSQARSLSAVDATEPGVGRPLGVVDTTPPVQGRPLGPASPSDTSQPRPFPSRGWVRTNQPAAIDTFGPVSFDRPVPLNAVGPTGLGQPHPFGTVSPAYLGQPFTVGTDGMTEFGQSGPFNLNRAILSSDGASSVLDGPGFWTAPQASSALPGQVFGGTGGSDMVLFPSLSNALARRTLRWLATARPEQLQNIGDAIHEHDGSIGSVLFNTYNAVGAIPPSRPATEDRSTPNWLDPYTPLPPITIDMHDLSGVAQ